MPGRVRYRDALAVVTGAASGIGRALAAALVQSGARVVLADLSVDRAAEAARALDPSGDRAHAAALDVTSAEAFHALIDDLEGRLGPVDLLFNNAGIGLAGEVRDTTLADWERVFAVNVRGVIHGIQAVYPRMAARGRGAIVNTASGAGLLPRPGMVPYAAAKHAVVGLVTSLAPEAHGLGVSVHAVCPGYIETNIQRATTYRNLDAEKLLSGIPIRPMSAERCAKVVLRGVARGRVIIPVTALTWLEWWLFRLSPSLVMRIMRLRAAKFREQRIERS